MNLLVTLGVAVGLTDRFARTRRRGLGEVLDTTTAGPTRRMLGTLLGALTVALAPAAVGMLALGGHFAITRGAVTALGWAIVAFVAFVVNRSCRPAGHDIHRHPRAVAPCPARPSGGRTHLGMGHHLEPSDPAHPHHQRNVAIPVG